MKLHTFAGNSLKFLVLKSKNVRTEQIQQIKQRRNVSPSINELIEGIQSGDQSILGKAITLIESTNAEHFEMANTLLEACMVKETNSIRIGITGVPGVGKSTFIEAFGSHLTQLGKKVAVLAVDPSSSLSKGSILGDKTRMETLANDPNAFIRPSPSGDSLGGVSRKSRESIVLCEAAGFDVILIETVGVGQSETLVHSMVDFFLLLKLAGAGDELQGIKRGIMEMADAIVINKADGSNLKQANSAKTEFTRALHLYPPKASGWTPKVLTASAIEQKGITEVWELIETFIQTATENGHLRHNRIAQNKQWFLQSVDNELKHYFYQNPNFKKNVAKALKKIENNSLSPFHAAKQLVNSSSEIKA